MKKTALWAGAVSILSANALFAQNIAGDWQGTLKGNPRDLRIVVQIVKTDSGGWKALIHSIDQIAEVIAADSVTLDGSTLKVSAEDSIGSAYEGKISADGAYIAGNWAGKEPDFLGTQGQSLPLLLRRATKSDSVANRSHSP